MFINRVPTYVLIFGLSCFHCKIIAHQTGDDLVPSTRDSARAIYLGNEGVMVARVENNLVTRDTESSNAANDETKILFDPFFHSSFGVYTLVPDEIRQAIYSSSSPYDNISVIFISHAHADHFDAKDVLRYVKNNPHIKIVAPGQAVNQILALPDSESIKSQLLKVELGYGDEPIHFDLDKISVDAIRIPHAGWPQRSNIENIIYRVTLNDKTTVMHLGDADPNDKHYQSYNTLWQSQKTDLAFPPYWFFLSQAGRDILEKRINTNKSVGIHVDKKIPSALILTGEDYFSEPGEVRTISHSKH